MTSDQPSPRFHQNAHGVWRVTLPLPLLGGGREVIQRCLGTRCSRTARKRCDALRQALGL